MKKKIKLPKFRNEDEERRFWSKLDMSDYLESGDFKSVSFPNLKATSRPVSIRIPEHILIRIKEKANELGMPYQSLIKEFLAEGIKRKK